MVSSTIMWWVGKNWTLAYFAVQLFDEHLASMFDIKIM